ncbi:hypothetical protein [Paraglaciecola sp. 25GB23A]|uniref:hypothetical protein n=1 Tax=Paraglaciecola sp. 25GB23A TaxID=3156068 RepID=UPI0032AF83A1
MTKQVITACKVSELERHCSEIIRNGFTVVKKINSEEIDDIYRYLGKKEEIADKRAFEDTLASGNINFVGWREVKTKYFSTADQRNPDIIIPPHCESNPRGGSFQVAFFYCQKSAETGGESILIPSENIDEKVSFKRSIFIPVPGRLKEWPSFVEIIHHTFPFLKKMPQLFKPLLLILFLLLFANNIIPSILRLLGIPFVIGSLTENGIPIIRFSKFAKQLDLEKALNGQNYRTLGFSEGFYDFSIREKFSEFILKNNLYFKKVKDANLFITKSEEFRYKPLYHSQNDFCKLFNNSVIVKLDTDELLIIDNRRFMHSSTQYQGERHMYASFL